ncbi:hypothetical protein F2Q69_00037480 [Brassica cretica]|uniref:Uncharacterized protein n=1 Tax=Brassica cretica TaxID=69181 RepID=A0A8S9SM80_BRACR|nr:hypothetical protein F2Q69_00037480 [Brassica cretica]
MNLLRSNAVAQMNLLRSAPSPWSDGDFLFVTVQTSSRSASSRSAAVVVVFQHSSSFQLEPQFIFAETSSLLVKLSKGIVSVSLWNKSYLDEPCLVLGVSCLEMSPLPLNEDLALPLNLLLPQFEDVASDQSLPLYEDVTLCSPPLVPQYGVGIRTFVLLALVSMVSGTDASKNGGFGWCIHGVSSGLVAGLNVSHTRLPEVASSILRDSGVELGGLVAGLNVSHTRLPEVASSILRDSGVELG